MDAGTWRGIFAVVMLVLFIGIWAWAWSARRKPDFEAAARLPLEPDDAVRGGQPVQRGAARPTTERRQDE